MKAQRRHPGLQRGATDRDTLRALVEAGWPKRTFEAELVVVDDGSTDGSAEAALPRRDGAAGTTSFATERRPVRGPQRGARGRDRRLRPLPRQPRAPRPGLRSPSSRAGSRRASDVWNAPRRHRRRRQPVRPLLERARRARVRRLLRDPRTTSFGAEDFDRFPKGTTCFLAPRSALLEAFAAFSARGTRTRGTRTTTRRSSAGSPRASGSTSRPRSPARTRRGPASRSFVRHAVHRGIVFLDGHGRRESRVLPARARLLPAERRARGGRALRQPAARARWLAASARCRRRPSRREPAARRSRSSRSRALAPVYAVAHGAGMWRGSARGTRRLAHGARDPRRLRDDRRADQARAGAHCGSRARARATCSRRRASRCSRSRRCSSTSGCRSPISGSAAAPAGATCATNADIPGWLATVRRHVSRHRRALCAARSVRARDGRSCSSTATR